MSGVMLQTVYLAHAFTWPTSAETTSRVLISSSVRLHPNAPRLSSNCSIVSLPEMATVTSGCDSSQLMATWDIVLPLSNAIRRTVSITATVCDVSAAFSPPSRCASGKLADAHGECGGRGPSGEYAPLRRPMARGLYAIIPSPWSATRSNISDSRLRFRRLSTRGF